MASDYCIRCGKTTEQRCNGGPDWTEWRCVECGAQTDVDYYGPDECYDYSEPVGSCGNCGVNLYEDDDEYFCDGCLFMASLCRSEEQHRKDS